MVGTESRTLARVASDLIPHTKWLFHLLGKLGSTLGLSGLYSNWYVHRYSYTTKADHHLVSGLVLLVDFAHSFTEMCLINWENSNGSNLWQYILVGSTFGLYAVSITLTGVMYGFFADSGCTLNR
jgi:hypothetical protein